MSNAAGGRSNGRAGGWTSILTVGGIVLAGVLAASQAATPPKVLSATGSKGMVVSTNRLAAEAGLKVLQDGGNAVDAAVAVGFTLAVVEPEYSGVGGKGEMLIYEAKTGKVHSLDFSGAVPAALTMDRFKEPTRDTGILSAAIPGTVAGWTTALATYGTKPLAKLMEPAIGYAEQGFPITDVETGAIKSSRERIARFPASAKIFLPGGQVPKVGDVLVQKDLAQTLRTIATDGPDAFYRGSIAKRLVAFSQGNGGAFAERDLATYKARWEEPLSTSYRGYQVFCTPAPSFGPAMLELLNILERSDVGAMPHNGAGHVHLFVEAAKLASADALAYIGDPNFMQVPQLALIAKPYAERQAKRIDPKKATSKVLPGSPELRATHTTNFSVADADGNVVSVIQTLNGGFGSAVVFGDTGVLLNNNMYHLRRDGPSRPEPGKRMRHPSVPAMVLKDGKPVMSVGGAGSSTIWLSVAQVLSNFIDFKLDAATSVSSPRFTLDYGYQKEKAGMRAWDDYVMELVSVEQAIPQEVRADLTGRGHVVKETREISTINTLRIDPKTRTYSGGADARGGGHVAAW